MSAKVLRIRAWMGLIGCLCFAQAGHAANVVISQVYGGGNIGAQYRNDFIELRNKGSTLVSLSGWTIQYADSVSNNWQLTFLGGTLQPGQYYLIQQAQGSGGTLDLPTPNASSTINLAASSGKVALVSNGSLLTGTCPSGPHIIDFVGYGTANCSETSATSSPGNTTAAIRSSSGCTDTDNNNADFSIGAPTPRNTGTAFTPCAPAGPVFVAWNKAPNGAFTFQFTGDPGKTNRVEFSTNLTSWITLTTALSQAGNVFSGADTNPATRRYYRVIQQ